MEPVHWDEGDAGMPRSARFGEPYRSRSGALAQARTVFLQGCGLPERWQGADTFTVLELGFGLGLNALATWAAWRADARRSGVLRHVAIEAWPVTAGDIVRSARQAVQAEVSDGSSPPSLPPSPDASLVALATRLAEAWPAIRPGLQHWALDAGDGLPPLHLTLAVGDVQPMLAALAQAGLPPADAVYLDGFSPAVNPQMWSPEVLTALAAQCRTGARLATYSAARAVRDALTAAGFAVQRRPGLPPKRHRLEAQRLPTA